MFLLRRNPGNGAYSKICSICSVPTFDPFFTKFSLPRDSTIPITPETGYCPYCKKFGNSHMFGVNQSPLGLLFFSTLPYLKLNDVVVVILTLTIGLR